MICVTGSERAVDDVRKRLARCVDADLHEIRFDLLDDPRTPIDAISEVEPSRLLVTCRPERQGGRFDGDERTRLRLLIDAVRAGVGFVDLEADVDDVAATEVLQEASKGLTRVIRSQHIFEIGADARSEMERLRSLRGHVLKLAVGVDDAADLAPLHHLGRERDRPVVLIGMGPAGVLARACYRRFGSAWTYVASNDSSETAAGQLDWKQAQVWGLVGGRDPAPVVLLGGAQVHGSPGPSVYNALFRQVDAPLVYVPVETDRPGPAIALLRELGFMGGSVTMPLKERIADQLDEVDEAAAIIGATNTIWKRGGRLLGTNTDGTGVVRALHEVRSLEGARALVIGAGGAARAAVHALAASGVKVSVFNRTRERAEDLVEQIGSGVVVADGIDEDSFDVLINATSIGLHSTESPVDAPTSLRSKVVLDCVAQPPRTRLLEQAAEVGAETVSGVEMWLHQGAAQASLWLGEEIGAEALRKLLPIR